MPQEITSIWAKLLAGFTLTLALVASLQLEGQDLAAAQQVASGNAKVERFEVETIKPSTPASSGYPLSVYPNGRIKISNWTLKDLIHAAYGVDYWQMEGGPAWIEEDHYDIQAKPPDLGDVDPTYNVQHDNSSFEDPKLRSMLRALLEDRFQLKTHIAAKKGRVSILERGDGPLTLSPAKQPSSIGSIVFARGVRIVSTNMSQLATFLGGNLLHETVVDKTGIEGTYDFRSKTGLTEEEARALDLNAILDMFLKALKEMGLKLTQSTGPVTRLVIDQAAQPSPN